MGCSVEGVKVKKGRYLGSSERKRSGNIEVDLINEVNQVETGNSTLTCLTMPCA